MAATDDPTTEVPAGTVTATPDIIEETAADRTALDRDFHTIPPDASLKEYTNAWLKRVRSGESGVLPVVGGLIVIMIVFQLERSVFLHAGNLVNLLKQSAAFIVLGMAEIFVLLLGEIDLSLGYSGAVGGAVMAILAYPPINFGWAAAIACGLATTTAIGFAQGMIITRLRLPSFVVTLAGLLLWEGFLIWVIDNQSPTNGGSIAVFNKTINGIEGSNISPLASWIILAVGVALFAVLTMRRDAHRRASGLVSPPVSLSILKIAAVAAGGVILVAICTVNRSVFSGTVIRGVPWVVPIVLAMVISATFLLQRTRFGRYVYAIGGNKEAARRAGINVNRIRVIAFSLAGLFAAAGAIITVSEGGGATTNVDGGQIVLYGVAAAVIGGTSLLGGRGKMVNALLGGLVIATIYNGMGLLSFSADIQYMVTAMVLLAAVTVDALSRRGSAIG